MQAEVFRRWQAEIAAPELRLDQAFDIAIRLESSEINDVYSQLTAPIEGPAYVTRKKIELALENHFEKLFDAARKFGASPQIQTRLANLLSSGRFPHIHH